MTNTLNKIIHNGDEYNMPVTSVNGQTGNVTIEEGITKIFTLPSDLTSQEALTNAQAAYDWYANGGRPIIQYNSNSYTMALNSSTEIHFFRLRNYGNVSSSYWLYTSSVIFTLSSGSVTTISQKYNAIKLSSLTPTASDNSIITLII